LQLLPIWIASLGRYRRGNITEELTPFWGHASLINANMVQLFGIKLSKQ